jgi:hypothetical protein
VRGLKALGGHSIGVFFFYTANKNNYFSLGNNHRAELTGVAV